MVWKYFNFSVSLSADCLWFLSLFAIGTVTHQSSLDFFSSLLSGSWWWKSDGNYGTRKTLLIKVRKCPVQQDPWVLLACLKKRYLKLCSWPRRKLQTAPDAKRAILKKRIFFYFGGVDCFQIIVFFACGTYSFVDIIIAILYLSIELWMELISIGLNTVNPMFTGSWLSPQSAVSSHCLLPVILVYSKHFKRDW